MALPQTDENDDGDREKWFHGAKRVTGVGFRQRQAKYSPATVLGIIGDREKWFHGAKR